MRISARGLAWMQRIAAAAILLYWISFWADHDRLPANIVDFEWCFLVPDIFWIAAAFWVASRWLIAGDRRAALAGAVAGGSMVYLGLLDMMINWRHGQYTFSVSRGLLNAGVNLSCVVFGFANIWFALARIGHQPANK